MPGPGSPPPARGTRLLIRRHLGTGEMAYHYCYVPAGQLVSKPRLISAAGLRWPVEENFEFGKDCFGLDQSQVRLYTAITRHTVLVMAALAVCAIAAARARPHRHPGPAPGQPRRSPARRARHDPADRRGDQAAVLAALTTRPLPLWHVTRWSRWTAPPPGPRHAGTTNAPGSPASTNSPRSNRKMRLPYQ